MCPIWSDHRVELLEPDPLVEPEPLPEPEPVTPSPEPLPEPVPLVVPVRDDDPVDDPVELVSDEQPHNRTPKLQEIIAADNKYL